MSREFWVMERSRRGGTVFEIIEADDAARRICDQLSVDEVRSLARSCQAALLVHDLGRRLRDVPGAGQND
jgi:hypothetical protein